MMNSRMRGATERAGGRSYACCRWIGWLLGMIWAGVALRADPPPALQLLDAGTSLLLTNRSAALPVYFRALRPTTSPPGWTVDVIISNATATRITGRVWLGFADRSPAIGVITGASAVGDVLVSEVTSKLPPTGLAPGTAVSLGSLAFGGGAGAPNWRAAAYVPAELLPPIAARLAYTRVLDGLGLPLEGVEVVELGPAKPRVRQVGRGGWVTMNVTAEVTGWLFRSPGRLTVYRAAPIGPPSVSGLVTVRLPLDPAAEESAFTPQTLPGLLPRGWSPLAVRRIQSAEFVVTPGGSLPAAVEVVLVRWEESTRTWRMVHRGRADPSGRLAFPTAATGLHAAVIADATFQPSFVADQILPGSAVTEENPSDWVAEGRVNPPSRSASRVASEVVGEAIVDFRTRDGVVVLPSGLNLLCDIRETYVLKDGSRRVLPRYCAHITGYSHPSGNGGLRATFPLRPTQLLGNEELSEALVHVEVLSAGSLGGGRLSAAGGELIDADIVLRGAPGTLEEDQWVEFTTLPASEFRGVFPGTNVVLLAAELNVAGLVPGRSLELDLPRQVPNRFWVLGRAVFDTGVFGFEPVARLISTPTGQVRSVEPAGEDRLPGLNGSGLYLLVEVQGPQGLVRGEVRNRDGQLGVGFPVRSGPWMTLTDAQGGFRSVAPVGTHSLTITDPTTGNGSLSTVNVLATGDGIGSAVPLNVTTRESVMQVAEVVPAPETLRVPRIVTINIRFSQPVNSLGLVQGGLTLTDVNGVVIPTSLGLNDRNDLASLRPLAELAPSTRFIIRVGAGVVSASGQPVEGSREFGFTTQGDSLVRGLAGRVTIFEPGATNVPAALLARIPAYRPTVDRQGVVIHGTLGSAEPETPVVLVNESSGETATVLSAPDGSFVSFIRAGVEDFVSAVVQNSNGTRNTIPASAQRFDDGSVALYRGGGIIDAVGEENGLQLAVESGLVSGRTKFRLASVPIAEVLARVGDQTPVGAAVLRGFRYEESGDPLNNSVDLGFPVRVDELGLAPGVAPTNGTFVLAIPRKIEGVVVYDVIDTLEFEPTGPGVGRLATHSPPFPGLLARRLATLQTAAQRQDALATVELSAANPVAAPAVVNGAVLTVDMPLSAGGKIAGRVLSAPFDPGGVRLEPSKPVAGALVVIDSLNGARPPGFLKQGELVVTSDLEGHFATVLRPSDQGRPRELLASHPRFPFQTARVGIGLAQNATAVGRVEVVFAELAAGGGTIQGTAKPVVQVAHLPALPSLGEGEDNGATLVLSAFDDVQVKELKVEMVNAEGANGQPLGNPGDLVSFRVLSEVGGQTSRMVRRLKVTAKANLKANLKITVTDNLDQPVVVSYALHFGFSLSGVVVDPNENLGPYVSLVWPPPFSEHIPSLSPILVRFARPIHADYFQPPLAGTWIKFENPAHRVRSIAPSADRREATVFYDGPKDGLVKVSVLPVLKDENGHDFDQNPASAERDPFSWEFTQAGEPSLELEDGQTGGGIALIGGFAYALDRQNGNRGRLISYDLRNPGEPEVFDTRDLAGSPITLAAIPSYSLPKYVVGETGGVTVDGCETASFLAVFTGAVQEPKRLLILPARGRVTDPFLGPALSPPAVTAPLNEGGVSQIVKSRWDPPFLGYFELGAEVTSIQLLNLPAFYLGATLKNRPNVLRQMPRGGDPGEDVNGDGDYCDPGDKAPLPFLDPLHPFGFSFSFSPADPKERLQDFDFLSGLGLVAVVSAFNEPGRTNLFRVVLASTETESLAEAQVGFQPGQRPRRIVLLPAVRLSLPTGQQLFDLALVSVSLDSGGDGGLAVIDVTRPAHPTNLFTISLPAGSGSPGTIQRRADGRLALATAREILLLDPTKLGDALTAGGHPAFVGRVDLVAGGVRDFVSDSSGINAIYSGGSRRFVQVEPRFQLVTFDRAPFRPDSLLELPQGTVQTLLSKARAVSVVELAKTSPDGDVLPDVSPERHHYVLVDAPGGTVDAGRRLPLVLAGVDERGQLYDRRAKNPIPVVLGDPAVHRALLLKSLFRLLTVVNDFIERATREATGQAVSLTALTQSALSNPEFRNNVLPDLKEFVRLATSYPLSFEARRLSDDPNSPLYNRFLAGPVLALPNSPDRTLLQQLLTQAEQIQLDRRYLRASPRIWIGFPSDADEHPVVGRFASQFRLNPRITLEGISIPLASQLAEQLVDAILGGSDTLAPVLLAALSRFTPVQSDYLPTLLPGASLLLPVAYKDRPLILVPGFAGSRLRQQSGEIWPGFLSGINRTNLSMRPDGTSVTPTSPSDALRHVLEIRRLNLGVTEVDDIGFGDIYGGFIKFLIRSQGYVEYDFFNPAQADDPFKSYQEQRRRMNGAPILTNSPAPDLFVFGYDWRRDSTIHARLLDEYVKIARYYHPDADGIDLIAHSNGNFVAREYMQKHPGVVRRFLALGAPWLGSGKPLVGMLTGDTDDLALNFLIPIRDLRRASQFMPGFHQLLPNRGLFDFGFPVITESGFDANRDGRYFGGFNYLQYADALSSNLFRITHGDVGYTAPVSPSRANAEGFHLRQGGLPIADARGDDSTTETHHLFSLQAVARSFAGVRYVGRLHRAANVLTNLTLDLPAVQPVDADDGRDLGLNFGNPDGPLGITTNQFRFRGDVEVVRSLGDGTVPLLSLARGAGAGLNYNSTHTRIHCLVSDAAARDLEFAHNPVLLNDTFRRWVEKILEGRRIDHLTVQATASPGVVSEGGDFRVTVTATAPAGTSGANSLTQLVDFGDGGTAARSPGSTEAPGFPYRYRQNGTYTVTVGVTTPTGGAGAGAQFDPVTGLTSFQIEVRNVAPIVSLGAENMTVALNTTFLFEAKVTDPGVEDTHTFEWFFDDRPLPGREAFIAAVNFSEIGEHKVRVVVRDTDGGEGSTTVTVQVEPGNLPVAQPAGRGRPRLAADGELVFARQPELKVRLTGVKPGPFDTRGVVVRDQNNRILAEVSCNLPVVCDAASTFLIASRVLLNSALDAVVQRTSGITVQANLVRRLDVEGAPGLESFVEFLGRGGPLEIEASYQEGGVPVKLALWRTNIIAGRPVSLGIHWESKTISLRVDDQSQTVPPDYFAEGAAAGDRQPPAVAAIFNPATGNVNLFARDNISPTNKLRLFLVQDTSPDSVLDNDVFYELGTNVLVRSRLPSRPFAIVAEDEAGNVSPPSLLRLDGASDYTFLNPGYCDELISVRTNIQNVIQDALDSEAVNDLFLLQRDHLWIFEQGSGACLWKPNSCAECNGNYNPKTSDNDYQLFLPVHLQRNFTTNETDRAEFLAQGPYEGVSLEGDWYHKRPVGLDETGIETTDRALIRTWQYQLPPGFESRSSGGLVLVPQAPSGTNLVLGFPDPLTPAEVIARAFTIAVDDGAGRAVLLKEVSFFPVRRENFMFGALDLELPPAFGADPIADGGCGRQMLLLKWALEGAFVEVAAALGVNRGLPLLDHVYRNTKDFGVPLAEGFEWGILQEFIALDAGVAADAHATYGRPENPQVLISGAGNELVSLQRKKLKKLGKAAIRGALARLAGDPDVTSQIFGLSRQDYLNAHLPSFEDFILRVATNDSAILQIYGEFGPDRPTREGPDLAEFLALKKGEDEQLIYEILRDRDGYARVVRGGLKFLRSVVQTNVEVGYDAYLSQLSTEGRQAERGERVRNLHSVLEGDGVNRKGLNELRGQPPMPGLKLVIAANNYTTEPVTNAVIRLGPAGDPAPSPSPGASSVRRRARLTADPPEENSVIDAPLPLSGDAEGDDVDEQQLELVTTEGAPTESQLDMALPSTAEGLPAGESTVEGSPVVQPDGTETPAPVDLGSVVNPQDDNDLDLFVDRVEDLEAAAEIREELEGIYLDPSGRDQLTDHPRDAGRNQERSPARYLKKNQGLFVRFHGRPEQADGTYQVKARLGVNGAEVILPMEESASFPGIYQNATPLGVQIGDATSVPVKDEDLLIVEVAKGGESKGTTSLMIDVGELAAGGIKRFYGTKKPAWDNFKSANGWANRGVDIPFDDDVGRLGFANPMAEMIRKAAAATDGLGEADLLFTDSHGNRDGILSDDASPGNVIYSPAGELGDPALVWGSDVEWVQVYACHTLAEDGTALGRLSWEQGLKGRRPVHGILGAKGVVLNSLRTIETFHKFLKNFSVTDAYAMSMELALGDREQPWAIILYEDYKDERLFSPKPDLIVPGTILYLSLPGNPDPAAVCGQGGAVSEFDGDRRKKLVVDLTRSRPSQLRIVPQVSWSELENTNVQRRVVDDVVVYDFRVPLKPGDLDSLDAASASAAAESLAARALASPELDWVVTKSAPETETRHFPDGKRLTSTNGFAVYLQQQYQGISVLGARTIVKLGTNGITRVATSFKALDQRSTKAQPALAMPVSAESARAAVMREAASKVGFNDAETLEWHTPELVYAPNEEQRQYRLVWRFLIGRPPPNGIGRVNYWGADVDASTGGLLHLELK